MLFIFLLPMVALSAAGLVLAIVVYVRNAKASRRLDSLTRTVRDIQAQIALGKRAPDVELSRSDVPEATPTPAPPLEPEPLEELELDEIPIPAPPPAIPTPTASSAPPKPENVAAHPSTTLSDGGRGLERQFGTRVAVWLGAVALALAGGFLVKYSVEQGLIGPTARVVLGLLFGVSLLGVGESIAKRYGGLAQGLDAAGIAVLYAVLLAGFKLYGLYPPLVAFFGMALTTAAAVVLSIRRGQLVAALGLLGGYLTPILIGSVEPRPWMLLIYLVLLQTGLLVVSRRMRWGSMAYLTLFGVMGWALFWMSGLVNVGGTTLHVALLLVISMVWFVISAGSAPGSDTWGDARVPTALIWGAMGLGTVLLAALVGVGEFGLMEWAFLGLVGAGCIVLGRLEPAYEGLAWIASLAGAAMLLVWGVDLGIAQSGGVSHEQWLLWRVALVLAVVFTGGSHWAMWGSVRPGRWAALASVSGTAYLLAAYGVLRQPSFPIPWGLQALVLAAVFAGLGIRVTRRRDTLHESEVALAACAVAVTTQVSLAVPMELERAWIAVAWALEIPALAWIASRLRVPHLSRLAWAMGVLVAVRLLLNPAVLTYPIGEGVLFNWLAYGYGIPIGAFVAGAILFRRTGPETLADALDVGAIVLGFAYLTLSVRQYFHPGDLAVAHVTFAEWGAWIVIWLLYGIGLMVLYSGTERKTHRLSATVVGLLAIGVAVLVPGFAQNPLWTHQEVGSTTIFNLVLWVYGLPAILAVILARLLRRRGLVVPSWVAGSAALLLGFVTLTLEVRQAFHGAVLGGGATTNAEMYTYSLVWVLFAISLLVAGIVTRGTVVRYGSIVVMLAAVGKVFLVDTAQLKDLYRVLSLFGLGVTLMVLAWIYHRFVFRDAGS